MKSEVRSFFHPITGDHIIGYELEPGDILIQGDLYSSTAGKWSTCPSIVGVTLCEGIDAIWVRPFQQHNDNVSITDVPNQQEISSFV